jgi:SRSO17 transposase
VDSIDDLASAAADSVAAQGWRWVFDEVAERIAGRFARPETRQTAGELLVGLLSPIERKNGWWLAEHAGHSSPDRMQRLLRTAVWDHAGAVGDLRDLVVARLGHPDAIFVIDETGFLKKGVMSVGVQRQYSGTAGRIENSQIGVFLTYSSPHGRTLIDARLYLPASWCDDPARLATAAVPKGVEFATKPHLALAMIEAAVAAGVRPGFATADEVYGADPVLRAGLRRLGLGYVLAIARNQPVQATEPVRLRPDEVAAGLDALAWERRSCGQGAKGERFYDWAFVHDHTTDDAGIHSLLIRRSIDTGELAFYRCWSPQPVPLSTLIRVAGRRWSIEETFQAAKTHIGLDHYQCRSWTAWHRFILLAMLALAILVITLAHQQPDPVDPRHDLMITMTIGELHRLTAALTTTPPDIVTTIHWSHWRRRHQATARRSHYKRRDAATSP